MLDVIDAVLQHCGTLDTDTERKTAVLVGVDAAVFQYLVIYDAGAEDFNPAGTLTKLTALAAALEAGTVYFYGWLGEWEVRRTETGLGAFAVNLLNELV